MTETFVAIGELARSFVRELIPDICDGFSDSPTWPPTLRRRDVGLRGLCHNRSLSSVRDYEDVVSLMEDTRRQQPKLYGPPSMSR